MRGKYTVNYCEFWAENCPTCGVWHLTPLTLTQQAKDSRGTRKIYCPNGHWYNYTGETEADKIRQERDRLKQENARLAEMRDTANRSRDAAEDARRKAVAALGRHKKRAAAGTCPCCKRTFSALATHMKKQHPQFVSETGAKVIPLKVPA